MPVHEFKTVGIFIDCPLERAYGFLCRPETFPQWAAGLGSGIERRGNQWIAATPAGEVEIRFTDRNPLGVLDHTVFPPGRSPVYVPMRVVEAGRGCLVLLTLFGMADWADQKFEADLALVRRDLEKLKQVLEFPVRSPE